MNRVTATFLPVASRPFETLILEPGDGDAGMLWPEMWDGSLADAVVRVRYTATEEQARRVDQAALRDAIYRSGAHKVHSIQPTIVRENRARVASVTEEIAPLAAVGAWCDANGVDDHAPLADLTARLLQDVIA